MPEDKPQIDWNKARDFLGSFTKDLGAAMLGAMNYIGDRLGLFKALADAGWVTSQELADRAALNERYVREWLGAVTSAGYLEYDAKTKRYLLPPEHALVLARDDSPFFMGGFVQMVIPNVTMAPKLLESFRTGKGLPQSEYPTETWRQWNARRRECIAISWSANGCPRCRRWSSRSPMAATPRTSDAAADAP